MLSRRILATATLTWLTAMLAGGCCCPPLSCRYGESGCPNQSNCGCGGGPIPMGLAAAHHQHPGHLPLLAHLGLHRHESVPSNQHYDYVSPTPKFHPVPTRPVFEPQPEYPPPHPLAGPMPRRRLVHEAHLLHHHQPYPAGAISSDPLSGEPHPARSPQPPAE